MQARRRVLRGQSTVQRMYRRVSASANLKRQPANRVMIWKREKRGRGGKQKKQKGKNVAYLVQAKCDVKGKELVYRVPLSLGIGNNR